MDAGLHDPTVAAGHPGFRRIYTPDRLTLGCPAAGVAGEVAAEVLPHFPLARGMWARNGS